MKRKQPFIEIIDLEEEYKDYKKLCKNNSKKYTYYNDWKKHLISRFKMLQNEHMSNFKHFLKFYSFLEGQSGNIFLSIVLVAVPITINTVFSNVDVLNTIATVIAVLVAAYLVISSYFDLVRRDRFVKDVMEVFEEYDKSEDVSKIKAEIT